MRVLVSGLRAFRPFLILLLFGLLILNTSRLLLFVLYFERVSVFPNWLELLLSGLRADLIMIGYLAALPLLLAPVMLSPSLRRYWPAFLRSWILLSLVLLLFFEAITPAFIAQYDSRPNRLFLEYLMYPKEILSTLWFGFRGWLVLTLGMTVLGYVLLRRLTRLNSLQPGTISYGPALLVWPLLVLLCLVAIRSTLGHRPANPAMFARTNDALVNSLLINSAYSVQYALYAMQYEASASESYGQLSPSELRQFVHSIDYLQSLQFPSETYPTVHWQPASRSREQPLNIVIVLEESLGYGFIERGLAPQLEHWAQQGWWLEQLYATGIRSVRGIEAVTAGFLPTPARSTVKLSLSQRHFFTLADSLQRFGYHTEFIYGGESHFDNMRGFFTGNGFQSIIDEDDYQQPNFVSSWGVSDEDLFAKTHERLRQLHQQQKPFFTLVFTSSNHEPFELPPGRISPYPGVPQQSVENAVRYADFALGNFLTQAKASNYWQDTLFLVVADHDSRVYGDALVPVDKFHIPGLLLGADLEPRRLREIASQIDLAPTLLSLAGISTYVPTLGQDLSSADTAPADRAFLQFNQTFALLRGNTTIPELVILQPDHTALYTHYDPAKKTYTELIPAPADLAKQALSWALLPSWLYREQRYFVPPALTSRVNPVKEVAPGAG